MTRNTLLTGWADRLPEHLSERVRIVRGPASGTDQDQAGGFVLYWMRSALRLDENPALDVARYLAEETQQPLLVYQGLSEHYRYASDRHHTFILQAAAELQQQFEQMQVRYVFHLATPGDRGKHLVTLADRAGIVVTEDMPVDPPRRFLQALKRQSRAALVAVDTACVVPMSRVGQAYTRAFQFRAETQACYDERLGRGWPSVDFLTRPYDGHLPFEPTDLSRISVGECVAQCQIDHSVGPVHDTPGGSAAGYRRWREFVSRGLAGYARRRNDALAGGVSRMSAYLHYGMVSPLRLAREAAAVGGKGAEKYLDELLIWRELAYSFCRFRDDHDQWSALPEWAQVTLEQHAADPRKKTYTWEQLARGQTDDEFWNAAQLSLLRQGELHNNVRMTWGKAIIEWAADPRAALRMLIDLNHRYALDGRDPASYGGILWCLGQFDRPFQPARPILGTVRPRSTAEHARRLPVSEFLRQVNEPRFEPRPAIAVVGGGLAGLAAARTLADHGFSVRVFEKSRGPGGRMSTRRANELRFDHGAQYFTARDPRFARYVQAWQQQGLVAQWPQSEQAPIVVLRQGQIQSESQSQQRWVAVPGMNAIGKHLAAGLDVQLQTRVGALHSNGPEHHELFDDEGNSLGIFQRVLLTAPAEQTLELLGDRPLAQQIAKVEMQPCWAAMVAFENSLTDRWAGAFVHDSFLSWVARNNTKPGRDPQQETLVLHATPQWTDEHWERDPQEVAELMLAEFWRVADCVRQTTVHVGAHRWKYALAREPLQDACLFDDKSGVGIGGDWLHGSRVEGAFLSGMAVAGRVMASVTASRRNG